MFLNLPNKKIKQVQKVINRSNNKIKPRITMTTKGLLQKQVIVLMSNDITKEFIKDSNSYVANINCAFKAIKSNVKIVDGGLYFIFSFYFYFTFLFFSFFVSIFRTAQVRVYQLRCHISHKLMA